MSAPRFVVVVLVASGFQAQGQVPVDGPRPGDAVPSVVAVDAGEVAHDWVIDEASGRVFASLPTVAAVVELDPATGQKLRQFTVPERPRQLLIRSGKLVVCSIGTSSLALIDLATNQVDGTVQLTGAGPFALFASQAANPWVYAVTMQRENSPDSCLMFQVDVAARSIRRQWRPSSWGVEAWGKSEPLHVAMSLDGRWALLDSRGRTSPSGAYLMRVDEEACTFRDEAYHHDTFGEFRAGPSGRDWMFGGDVYSLDISSKLRSFTGDVAAAHPRLDLVAGVSIEAPSPRDRGARVHRHLLPRRVVLQSLTSARRLATVELAVGDARPAPAPAAGEYRGETDFLLDPDDPTVQFDDARKRLLVGWGRHAHLVDLEGVTAPELYRLAVPTSVEARIGEPVHLPIALQGGRALDGTKLELRDAPAGMVVDGSAIRWTATAEQTGAHDVALVGTRGTEVDEARIVFDVVRRWVPVDGGVKSISLDSAGTRALIYVDRTTPAMAERGAAPVLELVLIALEGAPRVLAQRTVEPLQFVTLGVEAAYVASAGSARVDRLRLSDLAEDKRLFVRGSVEALGAVPGGLVLQDAEAVSVLSPDLVVQRTLPRGTAIGQVAGGIRVAPLVLETSSLTPVLLCDPVGLPALTLVASHPSAELIGPWQRKFLGQGLVGPGSASVARLPDGAVGAWVLGEFPLCAVLLVGGKANARTKELRVALLDLVTGRPRASLHIADLDVRRLKDGPACEFRAAGSRFVCWVADRLYVVDMPDAYLRDIPVPLHFAADLHPLVCRVEETIELRYDLRGGSGARPVRLAAPTGISVDEAAGTVKVTGAAVWRAIQEQAGGEPVTVKSIAEARGHYQRLLGVETDLVPVAVQLRLTARDDEGQQATLEAWVVILAPPEDCAEGARGAVQLPSYGGAPAPRTGGATAELEARVDVLEKALLSIIDDRSPRWLKLVCLAKICMSQGLNEGAVRMLDQALADDPPETAAVEIRELLKQARGR